MFTVSDEMPVMQIAKYFGPATVIDFDEDKNLVLLKINGINGDAEAWSRLAIPYNHKFILGDEVLAAGEDINEMYVIGILNLSSKNAAEENKLSLENKSHTVKNKTGQSEKFKLHTESGELIFEYDEEKRKYRVNVKAGDIEFVSDGSISFISKENIHFKSSQSIEMECRSGMRFSILDLIGKVLSSMSLRHRKIKLDSSNLDVTSQRADIAVQDLKYLGTNFSATIKRVKLIAGKFETIVNDIINRAKNVYSTVEELTQLKTKRMRTFVVSTLHIKAKNSYLKSEEDFKINGKKIHLG